MQQKHECLEYLDIELDSETMQQVESLAEQEKLTPFAMAVALLSEALESHDTSASRP